jgi:hypothetical protein
VVKWVDNAALYAEVLISYPVVESGYLDLFLVVVTTWEGNSLNNSNE